MSGGAGIDDELHSGAAEEPVHEPVSSAAATSVEVLVVDSSIERGVNAQISTHPDTRVAARNKVEAGTVQGADLHIFDRLGLDGKISSLRSAHGEKARY
ncbi:hypothetical protein ES703_76958 [subsurface metagenome]